MLLAWRSGAAILATGDDIEFIDESAKAQILPELLLPPLDGLATETTMRGECD